MSSSKPDAPAGERLQKVLAAAGIGSRRECEELILQGRVEIDRQVVTELGVRVDVENSQVRLDGEVIRAPRLVYHMLNKPTGVVTTNFDPEGRLRVVDLVRSDYRLFPVGRLDRTSEGLILLTNDGELANQLTHPRYGVSKSYMVTVAGHPSHEELQVLCRGVRLSEGLAKVESVSIKKRQRNATLLDIVLREGKNREIRRLLARVGHKVLRLRRVGQGPLKLGPLPVGESRPLTPDEVAGLRRACRPPQGAKKSKGSKSPQSKSPQSKAPQGVQQTGTIGKSRGKPQSSQRRTPTKPGGKGKQDQSGNRGPITPPEWATSLGAILEYDEPIGDQPAGEQQGKPRGGQPGRQSTGRGTARRGSRRGKTGRGRSARSGGRGGSARGGTGRGGSARGGTGRGGRNKGRGRGK